jgi:hypothetical protein
MTRPAANQNGKPCSVASAISASALLLASRLLRKS